MGKKSLKTNSLFTPFLEESNFLPSLESQSEAVLWLSGQFTLISNGRLRHATKEEHEEQQTFQEKLKSVIHPAGLFASWLLTWFTHDFTDNLKDSKAIFRFACSLQTPLAPVYLSASLLILNAAHLQKHSIEPFDLIILIRKLPHGLPIRKLISCTQRLHQLFPPDRLALHFPQLRHRLQSKQVFDGGFVIKLSLLVLCYLLLRYFFIK